HNKGSGSLAAPVATGSTGLSRSCPVQRSQRPGPARHSAVRPPRRPRPPLYGPAAAGRRRGQGARGSQGNLPRPPTPYSGHPLWTVRRPAGDLWPDRSEPGSSVDREPARTVLLQGEVVSDGRLRLKLQRVVAALPPGGRERVEGSARVQVEQAERETPGVGV